MAVTGSFESGTTVTGGDHDTKVVLDTNVWLDWLLFEDPSVAALRGAVVRDGLAPLATPRMRDELADVLARPAVLSQATLARRRRGLDAPSPARALAAFDSCARVVDPPPICDLACTDPDDQMFIDLAVAQRSRWLVSKDRALLRLAARARIRHGVLIVPAWRPGETAATQTYNRSP